MDFLIAEPAAPRPKQPRAMMQAGGNSAPRPRRFLTRIYAVSIIVILHYGT
jgi:hypothetical protein